LTGQAGVVSSIRAEDEIMRINAQDMVNRTHVNEIRVVGSNTQGVRIMGVGEGDKIASIAKIAHDEMEAAGEPIATEAPPEPPQEQGS